ncbi:hypothetical protein SDC9_186740 [bioreactor metagenome]|uniref:Uncharacterized protein n=1 Tax=bioreactor metagenome TaxID=1076179 RepID=A0A645HLB7_9ZZZZ
MVKLKSEREKHDAAIEKDFALFARRLKRIEATLSIKDGILLADIVQKPEPPSMERMTHHLIKSGLVSIQKEDQAEAADGA